MLAPGPTHADVFALVQDTADHLGADMITWQVRRCSSGATTRRIYAVTRGPALVLCGEYDEKTAVKRNTFLADLIPCAQISVIKGAGHLPALEQPDSSNELLHDWLRKAP